MRATIRGIITGARYTILPLICLWILTAGTALGQQTQTGDNPQRGFYPGGSYSIGDIETINTANGNLMLNIPIASLPSGRGGSAGPSVSLVYNSKLYNILKDVPTKEPDEGQEPTINNLVPSETNGWRGGWQLQYPLYTVSYENIRGDKCPNNRPFIWKVYVSFPDGSKHEFYPAGYDTDLRNGYSAIRADGWMTECVAGSEPGTYPHEYLQTTATMTYYSTDGSYLRLEVLHDSDSDESNNQWVLYFADGRKVLGAPDSGGNITYQRTYDRNNNYTEYQVLDGPNGEPGRGPIRLSDQLGRYITISAGEGTTVITAPGANNQELQWTVTYKNINVQKDYCSRYMPPSNTCYPGEVYETFSVVDKITLPAQAGGLTYQFGYNNASGGWGELNYVKTPSGAEVNYQYAEDGNSDIAWYRVLDNRPLKKTLKYLLEYDGVSTQTTEEWNYAFDKQAGKSTVTSPDGGTYVEYQYTDAEDWRTARKLVYKVEHSDGSVTERIWQSNGPAALSIIKGEPVHLNSYIKTEFNSIPAAGGGLSKTAVKDYSYDKNGNVTAQREYDWVNYGSIQRDSAGRPLDVTQQPALTASVLRRVTTNTYYVQTPDASDTTTVDPDSYDQPNAARLRGLPAATEAGDGASILSRTEYTYDGPTTTGNLTLQRSWDSTKGALLGTPQDAVRLNSDNSISTRREYDNNTPDPSLRFGNLTLSVDPNGGRTTYTYGPVTAPNGAAFSGLYPTAIVTAEGTSVQRTSSTTYDLFTGLVTKATDEDNHISTSTTHDDLGRPILVEEADNLYDANNISIERRTVTEYSDALRRVITRSDLNATGDGKLVSVLHYDQLGRVRLSRTLEDSTSGAAEDENAGIKVQSRYLTDKTAHASYQLISNPYRATHSYDAGVESTMGWRLSTSDIGGRVVRIETFSGAGLPAPFTTNNPNVMSTGAVVTAYDAEKITVTDQAGRQKLSVSDGLGRLTQVFEAPNNAGYNYQTTYSYDANGNLKQVVQGAQTRTFNYSSLSRLTSAQNPEGGAIQYQYDANGNLMLKIDPRQRPSGAATPSCTTPYTGNQIATYYQYDTLNRVKSRCYNDGTPDVTYTYDASGPNSKGSLSSISSNGVSTYSYAAYDALGRVTASSQTTGGVTYTMPEYKYDLAGNLTSEKYPSGRVVETQYDAAGRVAGVRNPATGLYYVGASSTNSTNRIQYTTTGAPASVKMGNGLWEHNAFNSRLQLTQIGLGTSATDSSVLKLDYAYGEPVNGTPDPAKNNGNVQSQTITVPGAAMPFVQSYDYDELNRLKSAEEKSSATTTWKQVYSYDRYGNRNFAAGTTSPDYSQTPNDPTTGLPVDPVRNPVFDASNNHIKVTATGQGAYVYDAAGNLLCESGHQCVQGQTSLMPYYDYDAENKLKSTGGGYATGGTTYSYDGGGRRVKKATHNGEETVFVYDLAGNLVAEYSNQVQYNGTSYLTQDHLGSTRVVTDKDGAVRSRHDYFPFGEEVNAGTGGRTNTPGYSVVDNVRKKFTGYERDGETGLDFAQARYYSSAQGRFISPDPMLSSGRAASPKTWNRYVYALDNPLKFADPTGLFEWDATLKDDPQLSDAERKHREGLRNAVIAGMDKARADAEAGFKAGRISQDELNAINSALDAYGPAPGTAGADNGVTVGVGTSRKDASGQTEPTFEMNSKWNGVIPHISVKFDEAALKGGNSSLTIAHEGAHVQDAFQFAKDYPALSDTYKKVTWDVYINDPRHISQYATENHGFHVQSYLSQAMGKNDGTWGIWQNKWSKLDAQGLRDVRQKAIDSTVSNLYGLSPGNPGSSMSDRICQHGACK